MSDSIALFALATFFAAALAFGLKTGLMPTYLTGGAKRSNEPLAYWVAATVLLIGFAGCLWGGLASL